MFIYVIEMLNKRVTKYANNMYNKMSISGENNMELLLFKSLFFLSFFNVLITYRCMKT